MRVHLFLIYFNGTDCSSPRPPAPDTQETGTGTIFIKHHTNTEEGEVFTWCPTCNKWLVTNEWPHTKKFHHPLVNRRGKYLWRNIDKNPCIQMMKRLGQAPSMKNKVWATDITTIVKSKNGLNRLSSVPPIPLPLLLHNLQNDSCHFHQTHPICRSKVRDPRGTMDPVAIMVDHLLLGQLLTVPRA